MKRDFLHVSDFTSEEIYETLELAKWLKEKFQRREKYLPFPAAAISSHPYDSYLENV